MVENEPPARHLRCCVGLGRGRLGNPGWIHHEDAILGRYGLPELAHLPGPAPVHLLSQCVRKRSASLLARERQRHQRAVLLCGQNSHQHRGRRADDVRLHNRLLLDPTALHFLLEVHHPLHLYSLCLRRLGLLHLHHRSSPARSLHRILGQLHHLRPPWQPLHSGKLYGHPSHGHRRLGHLHLSVGRADELPHRVRSYGPPPD
mmetsp:Transcript_39598/g.84583  ORF Transcript_39598/g.84583 Transcript_39598/m.84583 type:complete len:203 (+) Transcript_39598:829-1437(+)